MRKLLLALPVALAISLATVSAALADPAPGPIQVSGQSATTVQQASAGSSATQVGASNTNIDIRVLSPGNDGNVSQSNAAASSAAAGNASATGQGSTQNAGGSAIQQSSQDAATGQIATALSAASQYGASNTNVPIRVFSGGNDGTVTQSNGVGSRADAGNLAGTSQTGAQNASGSSCGCSGSSDPIQTAQQTAQTEQGAAAGSSARQIDPSNTNVSIRVLSPGNDGNVTQSNTAASSAAAGNAAGTTQGSTQNAAGSHCGCSGDAIQQAGQSAGTGQGAEALSGAEQKDPSNGSSPTDVSSGGNGGSTTQSNGVGSAANAGNLAGTAQTGTQSAGGSGDAIQTSQQNAGTLQGASAGSSAKQIDPSNTNVSVRVLSPGNDGNVVQSNTAASSAAAGNAAGTMQGSSEHAGPGSGSNSNCGCSGGAIQQAGQSADTAQGAEALSAVEQKDTSNTNSPVRVGSGGNGGSVNQSNNVGSSANAGSLAGTAQTGTQSAGGGSAIQIAQQDAATEQLAKAASAASQIGASNAASPVRVDSSGNNGSVTQSNNAGSSASAGDAAGTFQGASQSAASGCGCGGLGIQVLGQQSGTEQGALALSGAQQVFGSGEHSCGCGGPSSGNTASPVRVDSAGNGGSVDQSNTVGSRADAGNVAGTVQGGSQTESGGGLQIQVLGQLAQTLQGAGAGSLAFQAGARNDASPTRVSSGGNDGSVHQSNGAGSSASAGNGAFTGQLAGQTIHGSRCGCGSLPIQVVGQQAGTGQAANALSAAAQLFPQNLASPTRVSSGGNGGSLAQANGALSRGDALNLAATLQEALQTS